MDHQDNMYSLYIVKQSLGINFNSFYDIILTFTFPETSVVTKN